MRRQHRIIFAVLGIILLPILAYGIMQILTHALPLADSDIGGLLFTLLLIVLGLAVPYWMLKLLFRAAHLKNSEERGMTLKDISKDEDQLAKR